MGVDAGAHIARALAKPIAHRVFDPERCKVQAFKGAVLRCQLHLKGLRRGEPNFPRHLKRCAVNILLIGIGTMSQLHQHPLCQAAVQVEQQHVAPRALQLHAPTALVHSLMRQLSDAQHLSRQQVFYASGTG